MSQVVKEQNCSVNFLRFLFTFGICFMHLVCQVISPYIAYPLNYGNFAAPSYAVELFFIMAGFFLYFNRKSLEEYISSRIIRLWPLLFFSTIVAGLLRTFHISGQSLSFDDILNCLFLQGTGLMQGGAANGPAWFVGVLFWVSVIYFYFKRTLNSKLFITLMTVMVVIGLVIFGTTGKANPFENVRSFIIPAWGGGALYDDVTWIYSNGYGLSARKSSRTFYEKQGSRGNQIFAESKKHFYCIGSSVFLWTLCSSAGRLIDEYI